MVMFGKNILFLLHVRHNVGTSEHLINGSKIGCQGREAIIQDQQLCMAVLAAAASDKTIGERPVLDGVPDTEGDAVDIDEDTEGVH